MPRIVHQCCTHPTYKPVTHVIFDLDGTILDTEKIYMKGRQMICQEYGKMYDERIEKQLMGRVDSEGGPIFIKEMQLPLTFEEYKEKYLNYTDALLTNCEFMPGAEKLIRHLHKNKVPIAIATSSYQEAVLLKFANKKEVLDMFHHVVCGGSNPMVKKGKPHPAIFLLCASRFPDHPDPDKCLVFEDSFNGLQAALRAGMQTIMIPDDKVPYEQWKMATLRLDSMEYFVPEMFGLPPYPECEKPDLKTTERPEEVGDQTPKSN